MKSLEVVVGAQYGSEAKGHVTQRLVARAQGEFGDSPVVNVRVAGPNAGHTAYDKNGRSFALRQIPVGAVSENPVALVIAAGSEVDPEVLMSEIEELTLAGHLQNKQLWISPHATVIEEKHRLQEQGMVKTIGSTGKGIGAARAQRIMRRAERVRDNDALVEQLYDHGLDIAIQDFRYRGSDRVIVEGTQGYGLGLHGPHYPQCTSSDCRAIDFLAMAGINPWGEKVDIWAVARMFPIRVAGNSGPMYGETTWAELGLPEERTTVTKKVRRVGQWDMALVDAAINANGGPAHVKLALTMTDQRWPSIAGSESMQSAAVNMKRHEADNFQVFVDSVQAATRAHIGMVTTGPRTGFEVA